MGRPSRVVVTGGAGFIGSHLVEALVAAGRKVTVVDDLSSGKEESLAGVRDHITFVEADCGDGVAMGQILPGHDAVWHLAANPEVRTGETDPGGHYDRNVAVTFSLLESMRRSGVRRIRFTSTSTVYGTATVRPTPEEYGPLLPISVYGACKLACEALVASYCGTFGFDALLFRFANVVGPRSTHGVTWDFVHKLRRDPTQLEILGDGTQTKSYVSVGDTVSAMLHADAHAPAGCQAYNIGSLDAIPVRRIAEVVAREMGLSPRLHFAGGPGGAGWKGDVKDMALAVDRLQALGWRPQHSSEEAVRRAARAILEQVSAT